MHVERNGEKGSWNINNLDQGMMVTLLQMLEQEHSRIQAHTEEAFQSNGQTYQQIFSRSFSSNKLSLFHGTRGLREQDDVYDSSEDLVFLYGHAQDIVQLIKAIKESGAQ